MGFSEISSNILRKVDSMAKFTIYHNPRCSKSRETLSLLEEHTSDIEVIEYLGGVALNIEQLFEIEKKLNLPAKNMIRTKEEEFKSAKVDLEDSNSVFKAIENTPKLLERPIVVSGSKAIIGRPPENVKSLF